MTERRSTLKIEQNTYYPRLSFTPKTGIELPKTGVTFLLRIQHELEIAWSSSLRLIKSHILIAAFTPQSDIAVKIQ